MPAIEVFHHKFSPFDNHERVATLSAASGDYHLSRCGTLYASWACQDDPTEVPSCPSCQSLAGAGRYMLKSADRIIKGGKTFLLLETRE